MLDAEGVEVESSFHAAVDGQGESGGDFLEEEGAFFFLTSVAGRWGHNAVFR